MKPAIEFHYRRPEYNDLNALLELEQQAFTTDHLSRRRMRHWIHATNCAFWVCVANEGINKGSIAGYILFFYRKNTAIARLYSIAVSNKYRGYGIARQLMARGEQQVVSDRRDLIQLEVRPENKAAIALYHSLGYHQFGIHQEFYEDGEDALRFQKTLLGKSFSESTGIR